jgi:hypothetical protein
VVAISRKIADLQAEIAHAPAEPAPVAARPNRPDPPQLQQLKAQLRAAQQAMANGKQEQARIEQQVRTYEARIEASPLIEEEYKQVTRDHETALEFYNTLLKKMNESSMATALEHRQQGEQFRVMDAPNLPDAPTFPNRFVFAGGGACGRPVSGSAACGAARVSRYLPAQREGHLGLHQTADAGHRLLHQRLASPASQAAQPLETLFTNPNPLKARADNHVQILLRPSRPSLSEPVRIRGFST